MDFEMENAMNLSNDLWSAKTKVQLEQFIFFFQINKLFLSRTHHLVLISVGINGGVNGGINGGGTIETSSSEEISSFSSLKIWSKCDHNSRRRL